MAYAPKDRPFYDADSHIMELPDFITSYTDPSIRNEIPPVRYGASIVTDEVSAIFDWDMATLGDPLIELGTLLSYWREEGDQLPRAPTIKLDMTSFPTRGELIERFSQCGIDMTHIRWYEAFGLWKHAVVLQQLYNRFERGQSKDLRLGELKPNIDITLEIAHGVASTI